MLLLVSTGISVSCLRCHKVLNAQYRSNAIALPRNKKSYRCSIYENPDRNLEERREIKKYICISTR